MGISHRRVLAAFGLFALTTCARPVLADPSDELRLGPSTQPSQATDPSQSVYWRQNDPTTRTGGAETGLNQQSQFVRKDWELGIGVQGFTAWGHHGSDSVAFMTAELSYFIAKDFSIGLEAGVAPGTLHFGTERRDERDNSDVDEDTTTYSLRMRASEGIALARYHFFTKSDLSLYVDAGLGYLHATRFFPDAGKSDNWLATTGLGLDLRGASGCYFNLGIRFARLSGSDLFAPRDDRKASDGLQYYGGFSFEW